MDTKSPKMTKNKPPKAQQKLQQRFDGLTIDHFPKTPKGNLGVTARVQQFLEVCGNRLDSDDHDAFDDAAFASFVDVNLGQDVAIEADEW